MGYREPSRKPGSMPDNPPEGQGEIVVQTGSLAGQAFPLPPLGSLVLGREPGCQLRFDPEQERVVGRQHARIDVRPDGVFLVDLNSRNGTFLFGSPLESEAPLPDGAQFQLGEDGPLIELRMTPALAREGTVIHVSLAQRAAPPPSSSDTPALESPASVAGSSVPVASSSGAPALESPTSLAVSSVPVAPNPAPAVSVTGSGAGTSTPQAQEARQRTLRTDPTDGHRAPSVVAAEDERAGPRIHPVLLREAALVVLVLVLACLVGLAVAFFA